MFFTHCVILSLTVTLDCEIINSIPCSAEIPFTVFPASNSPISVWTQPLQLTFHFFIHTYFQTYLISISQLVHHNLFFGILSSLKNIFLIIYLHWKIQKFGFCLKLLKKHRFLSWITIKNDRTIQNLAFESIWVHHTIFELPYSCEVFDLINICGRKYWIEEYYKGNEAMHWWR